MPIKVVGKTSDRHPPSEWNSPERRKKRQAEYMEKHGPQKPRRKTLAVTDPYKKIREKRKFSEAGFKPLRASKQSGGRTNLYEELGRVEAEPSNRNRRAEISRVHGELNKGYAEGGPTGKQSLQDKIRRTTPKAWKRKNPFEALGGGEEGKPHSTEKGRISAGARKVLRHLKTKKPKTIERKPSPEYKPKWPKRENIMTPLRAKHGIGSIVKGVKKIVSKVTKPSGVFKPKPVPKAVTDVDKPFKGYDASYTKADDKKMESMLKKLGDEIKAQPIPPKTQKLLKKLQKAYPHARNKESKKVFKSAKGKAAGGRIGLKHGSAQSHYLQHGYGPTKTRLRTGKPKIAIKGWS